MKNLGRFNYWEFPSINPRLPPLPLGGSSPVVASASLADYYRSRFTAGEEQAIFEFAARDKTALRRRWVVVVLEAWQREGTAAGREKVLDFIHHYLEPGPGEETISLVEIIAADQRAFRDLVNLHHELRLPLGEAIQLVAQRLGWPRGMPGEVYRHYRDAVDTFFQPGKGGNHNWEEIFPWLEQCLENLKKL